MLKISCFRLSVMPLLALGLPAAAPADSGTGVDTWRANKLDPTAGSASSLRHEDGTSWLYPGQKRTPTGNLYQCPTEPPPANHYGGWDYSGALELGLQGVSGDQVALWNRYAGWDQGAMVGLLDLNVENASDGRYAEVRGSRISDENEYYEAVYGKAGAYKVQAYYREMPNILSTDAHVLWNGAGTNNLTLPSSLTPGASTVAQVTAASAASPASTLRITRSKEGLNLSTYLSPQWTAYADFTHEQRNGARPYGGSFFFNFPFPDNGGVLETVKPINDSTINLDGGLRYAGPQWRMDLSYSGSFYRDRYTAYDFQSPFALYPVVPGAVSAPLYQGQMSTEPDNDYHNIQATLTRKLPMDGELSVSGRIGRMMQDDALIAPLNCNGVVGIGLNGDLQLGAQNPLLFSCANWNTTAALSQRTANMRIDLSTANAQLVLRPSTDWTVRADLKWDDQHYANTYLAYNPLTGQYGYISENGTQGSIVPGEIGFVDASNSDEPVRIASLPLDSRTIGSDLGVDWQLTERNTLGATFGFEQYEPTHRERAQVDDHRIKLSWTNRSIDWLTLRMNYAWLKRTGDRYNYDPYDFIYSTSLPGYVSPPTGTAAHTVDAERKYDISSRDEHMVDVMATVMPRDDMTVTASVRGAWNNYDAVIGRTGYDTADATLQFEWQPAIATTASAYVAWSRSRLGLANVQDQQNGVTDPTLGGSNYALSGQWWLRDAQRDIYGGVTFSQQIRQTRLDLTWNYIYSRGLDEYTYAGSSALAYPESVTSPGPGEGAFPAMTYRVNSFMASLVMPLRGRLSLRFFDYYELGRISDWHYAGFDEGLVSDHRVYTDAGPQRYDANVIGVLLNVELSGDQR